MTKKEKLLKLMDEVQRITTNLKEVITAMSPDERAKLAEKLQKGH
ncbi:MAG: hypothetical protein AAB553_03200 [Patescibacteria group bacterium]